MHFGNIIRLSDDQGYGLIDFTDVRFSSKPLNAKQRSQNLAVSMRYERDVAKAREGGHQDLLHYKAL